MLRPFMVKGSSVFFRLTALHLNLQSNNSFLQLKVPQTYCDHSLRVSFKHDCVSYQEKAS